MRSTDKRRCQEIPTAPGRLLYALGLCIASTNENHGKGGCGAIELLLLSVADT
ncbi:MAG TPA: hypothetical protein VGF37_07535 [Chthoniobacterales bacterium]